MSKKNDGNEFERDNLDDNGVVNHDFKKYAHEKSYMDDVYTAKDKAKDQLRKEPDKSDSHNAAQNLRQEKNSLRAKKTTEQIQSQKQNYNEQRIDQHYQDENFDHLTRDESKNLAPQNNAVRNNDHSDKFNHDSQTNSSILQEDHANKSVLNKTDNNIVKGQNRFDQTNNVKQNANNNVVNRHENNLHPENYARENGLKKTNDDVVSDNAAPTKKLKADTPEASNVQSFKLKSDPANKNEKALPEDHENKNVLNQSNNSLIREQNHSVKNNSIKQNDNKPVNAQNNNGLKEQSNSQQIEGDYSSSLREKLISHYTNEQGMSKSAAQKQANKDLRKINGQINGANKIEEKIVSHYVNERGMNTDQAREIVRGILPQRNSSGYKTIKVDEKLVSKYIAQGMSKEQALNAAQRETLISNKIKRGVNRQQAIKQVDKSAQKSMELADKEKLITYYMEKKGLSLNQATKQVNKDLNISKQLKNDGLRSQKERIVSRLVREEKMSLSEAKKKANQMLPAAKKLKQIKVKKDDKKDAKDGKSAKKSNSNISGKLIKGVSVASTMLSVDKNKDALENILANAGTVITNELKKWVKNNVKKFGEKAVKEMLIKGYVKKGLTKTAAKKMANKAVKSVLKSSANVLSAVGTVSSLAKGDIVGAGKDAIITAAMGNPTQLIVLGVVLVVLILFGCMMAFGNLSDSGNSHSGNSYNYVEPLRNFENKQASEDETEEDPIYSATAIKNINNVYATLNDVFNGEAKKDKTYLSGETLKKIKKSGTLFSDLASVMVKPYNEFSYDIFDGYFINYFSGNVTDGDLKEKVRKDVEAYKAKKLIFNESVMDAKKYGKLKCYNTFKAQLDEYKAKFQKIKAENIERFRTEIKARAEESVREDYRHLFRKKYANFTDAELEAKVAEELANGKLDEERQKKLSNAQLEAEVNEKIIEKFKAEVGSNNILHLGTLELVVLDKQNIKISEMFAGKLEKDWQEFRELMGLLYYINYIDDIPEDRAINLNDYTAIINSLVDQIAKLNATLVYKKSNNTEVQISYNYGSSLVDASLLFEEKLLISHKKIYDNLIAKLSDSEREDTSDYEKNTMVKNLKILKEEIGKLSDGTKIGFDIVNPTDDNRLSKSYQAFANQMAQVFGNSEFSIDKENDYSRVIKKGDLAVGVNEIDITNFDKDFYFLTAYASKKESMARIDSLLNFIGQVKVNVQNVKTANDQSLKKVQDDMKPYLPAGYIYPDTKLDDIKEYAQNKITVGGKDYFYVEDASEVKGIDLDYNVVDIRNWFKGSDFYNKYFSDSSDYKLEEELTIFKNLLFAGVQIFEPVVNHKWEAYVQNNFGKNIIYSNQNIASSEIETKIPFVSFNDDFAQLNIAGGENIYAICSGVVVEKTNNSVKIQCKNNKELAGTKNARPLFDEDNTTLYVEYKNLSPSVNVNDKVLRYPVPDEHSMVIKESQPIGKAISTPLEVKCSLKDGTLINPLLIMMGDEELPDSEFVPSPSPSPSPSPTPSPSSSPTPTPSPTPTLSPTPTPSPTPEPKVLFADLLGAIALILKVAGRIYAVWAIIKFALGLHDYESVNYQAIWQFIGASVLIFGAMLLEYVSTLK